MKRLLQIIAVVIFLTPGLNIYAYPNQVKATLQLGFGSSVTGLALTTDNNDLFVSYADILKETDLGLWLLPTAQPPPLSTTDGTEGNLDGIVYSSANSYVYAVQDNGHILTFPVNNITATPTLTKPASIDGIKLGPVAIDTSASSPTLYIVDNASSKVYVWPAGASDITATVDLKQAPDLTNVQAAFNVLDILFASDTNEVYVATDVGVVAYFSTDNTGNPNDFVLDSTMAADIGALAVTPDGSTLYAATGAQLPPTPNAYPTIFVISTSTHQQIATPIQLLDSENTDFVSMETMSLVGGGVYGFVSGSKGVTVFNTSNDQLIDVTTSNPCTSTPTTACNPIPTSNTSGPIMASGDNYLYLAGSGNLLVITDNPWVDISSVTYKDSTGADATVLKIGGTCTITFQSDTTGAYSMMVGGNVNRTGKNVVDINGSSSGTATAVTDVIFTFKYNDNSANFQEGDNSVFAFVTSSANSNLKGRSAATVTVDTPPGPLTISSTGFGNQRAYITFSRLTVSDMNHYNLYSDTDPVNVQTKTDIATTVSQTSAGPSITGHIDGLTNGTKYYLAVEGVDNTGNIGPRAYLLSDGTPASALPQATVGPAGLSGDTGGCELVGRGEREDGGWVIEAMALLILFVILSRRRRISCVRSNKGDPSPAKNRGGLRMTLLIIVVYASFGISSAHAEEVATATQADTKAAATPVWWSMEVKSGFWMPTDSTTKKFFNNCCNIVTTIEGGLLYHGRYGAEIGVGVMDENRPALGAITGQPSSDTFNMFLLPMETNGVWRIDYAKRQWVVPYIKAGIDYVFYREGDRGKSIMGLKTGLHSIGGLQIFLPFQDGDNDIIKKMFFIAEARYGWVNSFGKKGLNLSGLTYSAGLLFEF